MTGPEIATERLYFNADKSKLVREGDPEARFLAASPGKEIPEGFHAPGVKKAAPVEDKAVKSAPNKAAPKTGK